jgi:hypothetical protein
MRQAVHRWSVPRFPDLLWRYVHLGWRGYRTGWSILRCLAIRHIVLLGDCNSGDCQMRQLDISSGGQRQVKLTNLEQA